MGTAAPGFRYKFKSDMAVQAWTLAYGYGPRRSTIKYFDAEIARENVKSAVEPGRVIILTPFKLHVFESVKMMTTKFREALQRTRQGNATKLTPALEGVRAEFGRFKGRLLASIDENSVAGLAAEIKGGEAFIEQDFLKEKQAAAAEVAREHGINPTAKALRLEYGKLKERAEVAGLAVKRRGGKIPAAVPRRARSSTAPPTFMELITPRPGSVPGAVVELEGPRGRMRIELKGVATAELVALSRALWGGEA